MDWKRIINNWHKRLSWRERRSGMKKQAEKERIEQYFLQLLPELNLRLLLDRENQTMGKMLWVEKVCLVSLEYPKAKIKRIATGRKVKGKLK